MSDDDLTTQEQEPMAILREVAQHRIREASTLSDELLELARELRKRPEFNEPIGRIATIHTAIRATLTATEAGRILAVVLDQMIDREMLDQGVPQ